ncbi:MAG: sigma-70 family RNA polymerase sigma factor [Bacteroidota bacterium]|nr:sigma-70 family RNA polymerase sigma factor [Bacteroidota bacterium]
MNQEILLWNGLRNGNEKDLHSLYNYYYNDLLRYGLFLTNDSGLSKEYINLLFLSLWNNRQKLPEVKNPKAYIITCYKNKIFFRKKRSADLNTVHIENTVLESVTSCEETLIELQEYEKLKLKLKSILASLTERQRQLIVFRFIDEMTYEEIADQLHISVRTVYNSIHESLKLLRSQVSRKDFPMFFLAL